MHETAVAQGLIGTILAESEKHGTPVSAKISCGTFSAVNDEVLLFAFEAIAKKTICEGMSIEIEHKPIQAKCKSCEQNFDVELNHPKCSACGSEQFELLPDAPLILEEIEFETE